MLVRNRTRWASTVPRMDLGISGRRAAVAAASGGLGLATARALAAEGVRVAICGRDEVRVDAAAALVGGDCVGLVCDVAGAPGGTAFVQAAS
jgi:3-oxoacyl-[acyl-carrier protein] reductase